MGQFTLNKKPLMKSVNLPKPGYASITCSTISNIPYNLIFTTKFNDSLILITILTWPTSFAFVNKRASYPFGIISLAQVTCAGECDWLFHWQHKVCATFSANVNINYRLPIKVYYRICTLRHTGIRIEINHGSKNVFWVLTWIGRY